MLRAARGLVVTAPLLLVSCGLLRAPTPAVPQPRYVVGPSYQAGGLWFYPQEDFRLDTTGLAVALPDCPGLTANGEAWDGTAMAGAHATLQLPAIARVTNLETGLQALVRINDRGPSRPGRLIGLTRRAADRLGIGRDGVARVRVQVEDGPSQALRDQLQGGAGVFVASAPRGAVMSESLAPPQGFGMSRAGRVSAATPPVTEAITAAPPQPARLPDTVARVPVEGHQLWLWAGEFGQAGYANQVRARLVGLGATVDRTQQSRSEAFRVRAGPFATVAQADEALDRALRAGVTDARIVVE